MDGESHADPSSSGRVLEGEFTGSYTWRITNFRNSTGMQYSEKFDIGAHIWRLLIFPRGNNRNTTHKTSSDFLAVYLDAPEAPHTVDLQMSPKAKFHLVLVNLDPSRNHGKETTHSFVPDASDWGFTQFVRLDEVLDPKNGWLHGDDLVIRLDMQIQKDERHTSDTRKEAGCVGVNKKRPYETQPASAPQDAAATRLRDSLLQGSIQDQVVAALKLHPDELPSRGKFRQTFCQDPLPDCSPKLSLEQRQAIFYGPILRALCWRLLEGSRTHHSIQDLQPQQQPRPADGLNARQRSAAQGSGKGGAAPVHHGVGAEPEGGSGSSDEDEDDTGPLSSAGASTPDSSVCPEVEKYMAGHLVADWAALLQQLPTRKACRLSSADKACASMLSEAVSFMRAVQSLGLHCSPAAHSLLRLCHTLDATSSNWGTLYLLHRPHVLAPAWQHASNGAPAAAGAAEQLQQAAAQTARLQAQLAQLGRDKVALQKRHAQELRALQAMQAEQVDQQRLSQELAQVQVEKEQLEQQKGQLSRDRAQLQQERDALEQQQEKLRADQHELEQAGNQLQEITSRWSSRRVGMS